MKRLIGILVAALCLVGLPDYAAADALQQQRFDAVVAQLAADTDPNTAIPAVYEYMEFYVWIGYSDPADWDPNGDIEREFGSAYTDYFARLAQRLNKRLGQCDPTVMDEVMEFIEFHEVGYSDGKLVSDQERIEKSPFWVGYLQWQANDALRDRIDRGEPEGPTLVYTEALSQLRTGKPAQQLNAAAALGALQPGGELSFQLLIQLLTDAHSVVRYWAVAMLAKSRDLPNEALAALRGALADHSWPVRLRSAELLLNQNDAPSRKQARALRANAEKRVVPWPKKPGLPPR